MESFVSWVDKGNFWIRGSYDPITDQQAVRGPLRLLPHQKEILGHCLTPNEEGDLPYTTVIYSCPKKSGKTTISAAVGAWFMDQAVADTEAYCLANDYEQATSRVFDDMLYDAKEVLGNWPDGKLSAKPRKDYIPYQDGKYMQALASEYKSVAGARQAMTLWDELWAYTSDASRRLWVEMTPIKIPGVPISLRFISTYAGFEGESELLWDLYTAIVLEGIPVPELTHIKHPSGEPTCYRKGRMFAYWDSAHRMPWQTEDYYLEQLASGMKQNEYARLHENSWVSGNDPFMPITWWDNQAVLDGDLVYDVKNPRRNLPVVIGCDASTKHDSTAVVGVQYDYENDVIAIAFHGIWTPTPMEPMDFERTLERYILDRYNEGFQISSIVYDPMQLHRSMTRLGSILGVEKVKEFPQSLKNMTAASETLYNVFKNHKILVYPDDELRAHMQFAMAEDKGKGFRIVKPKKAAHHHTDAAVALAMATYEAFKTHGYDTSQGIRVEVPFSDGSQYGAESQAKALEESLLPPQLRSGGLTDEEYIKEWERHVKEH